VFNTLITRNYPKGQARINPR